MRPSSSPPSACCSPRPSCAADQPVGRHAVVLEHQLGRVDALVAELLELAADREARALLGDEQAHAAVARLRRRVGLHQQREALAVDAVGDPGLGAVDDVAVAVVAARDRADRLQIGAAIGLGQREAAAQLAGREARQVMPASALRCRSAHRRRHDQVRIEDAGHRHPHPRDASRRSWHRSWSTVRVRHTQCRSWRRTGRAPSCGRRSPPDRRRRVRAFARRAQRRVPESGRCWRG